MSPSYIHHDPTVKIIVTRCWNKKLPNIDQKLPKRILSSFYFKVGFSKGDQNVTKYLGYFFNKFMTPRTFKNRPIWSHWSLEIDALSWFYFDVSSPSSWLTIKKMIHSLPYPSPLLRHPTHPLTHVHRWDYVCSECITRSKHEARSVWPDVAIKVVQK